MVCCIVPFSFTAHYSFRAIRGNLLIASNKPSYISKPGQHHQCEGFNKCVDLDGKVANTILIVFIPLSYQHISFQLN